MSLLSITDENWKPAPYESIGGEPLLFDVPPDQAASFSAELRRVGRLEFRTRWLIDSDDNSGRVLMLIPSPPAVLLSRIRDGLKIPIYREQWPGVWVALGHRLESAAPSLPGDQIVLIGPPNSAEIIPDGDFAGSASEITLHETALTWIDHSTGARVPTRLRLMPTHQRESARLWVLRDDALAQLTTYCRTTHQQLLSRFSVAVSASAGMPCVILLASSSKGPLPVFIGPAIAYTPVLKLANLYIPTGTRLAPLLRRDSIRTALGVADDRIVWLHPSGNGEFRRESILEKAFRPLPDWVDYRSAESTIQLRAWSPSHTWTPEVFVEQVETKSQPTLPSVSGSRVVLREKSRGLLQRAFAWLKPKRGTPTFDLTGTPSEDPSIPVDDAVRTALAQGDRLKLARPETAGSAKERCQELEGKLLKDLSSLMNAEGWHNQWAELAAAYDAANNHKDAAICWMNAVWASDKPAPLWAWGWLRAEAKAGRAEVKVIDPAPWLATTAGPGTTRALAAWVVWASQQNPPPPAFAERASEITARLESAEQFLPVRSAWLARGALARRGNADVLGLARTRDRLSDRLLAAGLSLEIDTPSFLRFAGDGVRERFHEARRWLVDKRDLIHQWIARIPEEARFRSGLTPGKNYLRHVGLEPEVSNTRAYVDFMLAWGLMRFGEHSAADGIRKAALNDLAVDEPVHAILLEAFEHRIREVREGKAPRGPLPANLLTRIEKLESTPRYAVDKLREHSRILEPTSRVHAFQALAPRDAASFGIESVSADRLNEEAPARLQAELEREGQPNLEALMSTLLDRAFEWREEIANRVFDVLPRALDRLRDSPRPQARMLERGLAAASLWDRADLARDLAGRFLVLADGRAGWDLAELLTGHTFRCLRRLGLKSDADRVLHHVAERILQGQPISRLRATRPTDWPIALRCLLHAAAGWYYAGRDDQAHAILDEARQDLFSAGILPAQRMALAMTYASTLGQAPARVALGRLEEIFQRLKGISVEGTTNAYYALNPLLLVDRTVRAVVSDDFAVGPQVRAWLDADELAVRRRIRDELKEMLNRQGL